MKIWVFIVCGIVCVGVVGFGQRTTRRGLKTAAQMSAPKAETAVDTVRLDGRSAATVRVTGYEKPLRASRETMMVTNGDSAATLQSVELSIQYLTTGNRQLHKRTLWVNVNAEPGGTVMATLPTWDVNRVFYYHKNRPSNRMSGQATPYLTKITPLRAVYDR